MVENRCLCSIVKRIFQANIKRMQDLPIISVVYIVSDVFEILHVRLYDETPKQGKVWVSKLSTSTKHQRVLSTTPR